MKNDIYWMQQAYQQACDAQAQGEVPVGAVIVHDGELLAAGCNRMIGTHDPSAHAEIVVIRQAALHCQNYRLPGTTLYVTLEPCAMCAGAIIQARIQRVVFAAHDPRAGAVESVFRVFDASLNHRVEWTAGVLSDTCAAQLRAFFQRKRGQEGRQYARSKDAEPVTCGYDEGQ